MKVGLKVFNLLNVCLIAKFQNIFVLYQIDWLPELIKEVCKVTA